MEAKRPMRRRVSHATARSAAGIIPAATPVRALLARSVQGSEGRTCSSEATEARAKPKARTIRRPRTSARRPKMMDEKKPQAA
jgi:hypothetical protein